MLNEHNQFGNLDLLSLITLLVLLLLLRGGLPSHPCALASSASQPALPDAVSREPERPKSHTEVALHGSDGEQQRTSTLDAEAWGHRLHPSTPPTSPFQSPPAFWSTPPLLRSSSPYITHTPISINGNTDFLSQAASEGWSGTGTIGDPIIIKGYTITDTSQPLISIQNTDLYFQIQQNLLNGVYALKNGVWLENIRHAAIVNNTIYNTSYGIYLRNATQNRIWGNKVDNIHLFYAKNNTLGHNWLGEKGITVSGNRTSDYLQAEVFNNTVGSHPLIWWQNVNGGQITTNTGQIVLINSTAIEITGQMPIPGFYGTRIFAVFSSQVNIHHNALQTSSRSIFLNASRTANITCNQFADNYVFLHYSTNTSIVANQFTKSYISLDSSTNTSLVSNQISNARFGIGLVNSTHNCITNNTITNTTIGTHRTAFSISLRYSDHNSLMNNTITDSYKGITLYSSSNNSLINNTIKNNRGGISLTRSSHNNTVIKNTVTEIVYDGITVGSSTQNTIAHNRIITNTYSESIPGIRLSNAPYNIITGNFIANQTGSGIHMATSPLNLLASNIIIGNGRDGIDGSRCANISLINNTLERNLRHGIYLKNSSCSALVGNTIKENSGDGIWLLYSKNSKMAHNLLEQDRIDVSLSDHTVIVNNSLAAGGDLIVVAASDNITIVNNTLLYGRDGIRLTGVSQNTIASNTIAYTTRYGVQLLSSSQTTIIANVFSGTRLQAITLDVPTIATEITWNEFWGNNLDGASQALDNGGGNTFIYNFWDDWASPDANYDGIVDEPYMIDGNAGNSDPYPQVDPNTPATSLAPLESSSTPIPFAGVLVIFGALITLGLVVHQRKEERSK